MHDNNMIKITEEKLQHVQLMKTYGKYVVISQEKQRGMLKKKVFHDKCCILVWGEKVVVFPTFSILGP